MRPAPAYLPLLLGALTAFGPMSIDMYLPSFPALARDLGTDMASVELTLSAFLVGLAAGQAVYGPLSDRLGRKPPLYAGCALYVAASVGCALARSIEALVVLRVVQSLGGCAGMVLARAVVRDLYEEQESARVFSLLLLVMGAAPILAPLVGGQILVRAGWAAIFWLLAAFGLACLAAVALWLPETHPPERRTRAGVGRALRVYGELLADRRVLGFAMAGGLAQGSLFAYLTGSPFVFMEVHGVAPEHYGWLFGLNALGLIGASQANLRLLSRLPGRTILGRALAVNAAAALVVLAVGATGAGGLPGLLAPLFVAIASLGFIQPNAVAGALAPHPTRAGSAAALVGTLQFLVGAAAGMLVGALHADTALPMAAVMALCGTSGWLAYRLGVAPAAPAPRSTA
ncbi:MAG TPA: Bcr/CflA family multidrug efflux MFS transporter [Thermodesulfobacteriota bacterium]